MDVSATVIGGSIGGLSSALALHCVNCDVNVYEKSSGEMKRINRQEGCACTS